MDITSDQVVQLGKNLLFFNNGGKNAAWMTKTSAAFPEKGVEDYYLCGMTLVDTASGQGLGFKAEQTNFDSKYINFQDQKTSMACADNVKVLASGGFSGCIFQLWRDEKGLTWGTHVYKGVDVNADISLAAKAKGWTLLYSIDTAGKGKDGSEIFVVAVMGAKNADIISQRIKNGKCEKLVDWYTVYDWKKAAIPGIVEAS